MNHLKEHILNNYWKLYQIDINSKFNYGTAGFRYKYGNQLKAIIFRMGILAALRSISLNKAHQLSLNKTVDQEYYERS